MMYVAINYYRLAQVGRGTLQAWLLSNCLHHNVHVVYLQHTSNVHHQC